MIISRETDLLSYLPPYLQEYKEIEATLKAEDPEFTLVWNAADRVFRNEFIATADEYGISVFESLLHIVPAYEDSLEFRRARVFDRWFAKLPYTMRTLVLKLQEICGENNFTVEKYFDYYRLRIETELTEYGKVDTLDYWLSTMIPCNMIIDAENIIKCDSSGNAFCAGGVVGIELYERIVNNQNETLHTDSGKIYFGGTVANDTNHLITDSIRETERIDTGPHLAQPVINSVQVFITNDLHEDLTVDGDFAFAGGAVEVSEFTSSEV